MVGTTDSFLVDGVEHCSTRAIMIIDVPHHVVDVSGSVRHEGDGMAGSHYDYVVDVGQATANKTITGYGPPYPIPKGELGWFMGGGTGPAPCGNPTGTWMDPRGSGVIPDNLVLVSGTVIDQSGNPVPDASVHISGPDHVTTTTDSIGAYGVLVHKGTYTVTVSPPAVDNGMGVKAVSCETGTATGGECYGDTKDVGLKAGFRLTCSASTPGPGGAASNDGREADATVTPGTPAPTPAACLQVYIKIVGPIPNVGTRSGLSIDHYELRDGPVNFTKLTGASATATPLVEAGSTGQQCVSGCANILITVVNKVTHKAVPHVGVDVQLGDIDTADEPNVYQQGTQFLCVQTDSPKQTCGTSLDDVKADDSGHVRLLYWAPGELVRAHVELSAEACTPSLCMLKHATSTITVYPYQIFHYDGELSSATVRELVFTVESEGGYEKISKLFETAADAGAEQWMEVLEVESESVKLALSEAGFAVFFTILDVVHMIGESLVEAELKGDFFDATGLSEAGLDGDSFAKVVTPVVAAVFENRVLSLGKVVTLGSGWLWRLGEQLAEKYPHLGGRADVDTRTVKPEPIDLSVYETSYCRQYVTAVTIIGEEARCGPGYGSYDSPNVQTDLCFYIRQLGKPMCGIYYTAPIWVASQEGVDNYLGHRKAMDTSLP
jgi:hypothetical protein